MTKDEIIEQIAKIDTQLSENKKTVDKYVGKTRDELGDDLFDALMKLADMTIALMVQRNLFARELVNTYGIFVM